MAANIQYPTKAPIPDPNLFVRYPLYQYHEYPKMALKRATQEDVEAALKRAENFDERRNQMNYLRRPPKLGSNIPLLDPETNEIVIFENPEEEKAFYEMYPHIEKIEVSRAPDLPMADDPEYQEFQRWKRAKSDGIKQASLFATVAEERADLVRRAEQLGLKPDKRWSHDRLRTEVVMTEQQNAAANQPAQQQAST